MSKSTSVLNKALLFLGVILLSLSVNAQPWAKSFRGTTEDDDNGYAIAKDAAGNLYVCGGFRTTVDFDPGTGTSNLSTGFGAGSTNTGVFIGKYTSSGTLVWVNKITSTLVGDQNAGYGIAVNAAGEVFITGSFQGTADFNPGAGTANLTSAGNYDVFIAKYDNSGNYLWANRIGASGADQGAAIKLDASSNIYVSGRFSSTVDFDPGAGTTSKTSAGSYDIYLASYDNTGAFRWVDAIGGTSDDYCKALAIDATGSNIVAVGSFKTTADFDPGAGTVTLSTGGAADQDAFVAKYSASNGNYVWAFKLGGGSAVVDDEEINGVQMDASDNIYVAGTMGYTSMDVDPGTGTTTLTKIGSIDGFFAKYNSAGALVWAKNIGSAGNSVTPLGVNVEGSKFFVVGNFTGTVDFDHGAGTDNGVSNGSLDMFFSSYKTTDASFVCKGTAGGTSIDYASAVVGDGSMSGSFNIIGWFRGVNIDFDPGTGSTLLTSGTAGGSSDIFFAKYSERCSFVSGSDVCEGDTINLSSGPSGADSYSWTGPNGFTSTLQNPAIPNATSANTGTYTVTVTVAGIPASSSTVVTVNTIPNVTAGNNGPVCAGSNVTLSASPNSLVSYSWTGPSGYSSVTQSPVVSPAVAGQYTLEASDGNCTATAITTVTVNSLPVVSAGNTGPVCTGTNVSLSAANGMISYSWTGPSGFTSSLQNPTLSPAVAGTYSVTVSDGNCSNSGATTVSLIALPVVSAGNNGPVCTASNIDLSATNGLVSYTWTGPSGFSSSLQNPTVTPAVAGQYTLTASDGTCSNSNTTSVVINSRPVVAASAPDTVCVGSSFSLTANNGLSSYTWTGPGGFTSNLQNPLVNPAVAGTYSLTASNGTCSDTSSVLVTVVNLPAVTAANSGPVCTGQTVTLNGGPNGLVSYSWQGPGGFSSLAQNPVISPVVAGSYTLTATDAYCSNTAITVVLVTANDDPSFAYSSGTFCQSGADPVPSITGLAGGTFSSGAGLSINPVTGIIDLSSSALGTYTIKYVTNGVCPDSATYTITITLATSANFQYPDSAYCLNTINPLPVFAPGSSAGLFSSSPVGMSINSATGEIDLLASLPGTYVVLDTIAPSGGCAGASYRDTVTLAEVPVINNLATVKTICSSDILSLNPISSVSGTTFTWSSANSSGLVLGNTPNGTGLISDSLVNTGTVLDSVLYSITPVGPFPYGCSNVPFQVKVYVEPQLVITNNNFRDTLCSGDIASFIPQSAITGLTFSWTATVPDSIIGCMPVGIGNINDSIVNLGTSMDSVVYTILPVSPSGICSGVKPFTYTVYVIPNPLVINNSHSDTICSGSYTGFIPQGNFPGISFSWTSMAPSAIVGCTPSGVGPIQDSLVNTGNVLDSVIYTITPVSVTGCSGLVPFRLVVYVQPNPILTNTNARDTICSGNFATFIPQSNTTGVTYSWTSWSPASIIGCTPSGTGPVNDSLVNHSNAMDSVIYTIVPVSSSGCISISSYQFTVYVTPNPLIINGNSRDTVCSGSTVSFIPQSNVAGVTYSWTATASSSLLGVSPTGSGSVSDSLVNIGNVIDSVVYTYLPVTANTCIGISPFTYVVYVEPNSTVTNLNTRDTICSGAGVLFVPQSNVSGVTFSWTSVSPAGITGGAPAGTGTINDSLVNTGTVRDSVVYTIVPVSVQGCISVSPFHYVVYVEPNPMVTNSNFSDTICSGNFATFIPQSNVLGVTFSWSAISSSSVLGYTNNGSGNINDSLVNTGSVLDSVVYTIVPVSNNACVGVTPFKFVVFVTPNPVVTNTDMHDTICSGNWAVFIPQSNVNGVTYSWTAVSSSSVVGYTASGFGAMSDSLVNTGSVLDSVVYTFWPINGVCTSLTPSTYTVYVQPNPILTNTDTVKSICSGQAVNFVPSSVSAGTLFSWTASSTSLLVSGYATNGTGSISDVLVNVGSIPAEVVYIITPISAAPASCVGVTSYVLTVHVSPQLSINNSAVVVNPASCGNSNGSVLGLTVTGGISPYTYNWTSATGSVISSQLELQNVAPGAYSLQVTDANGCSAFSGSYVVNTIPGVDVSFTASVTEGETPLSVVFTNTSTQAIYYNWDFGTDDTDTSKNPVYVFNNAGEFTVCVIGENGMGCVDTACAKVKVTEKPSITVPNIFTPNNDNTNDVLKIKSRGLIKLEAEIYNRWGLQMISFDGINAGWDGRMHSGTEASEGIYYYLLKATGNDGTYFEEKGYFHLVR